MASNTDKPESIEELRKKAAQLSALLKVNPDLIFRASGNGKILGYESGNDADLYLPPDQFLNKNFKDVLPAEVGSGLIKFISETLKTGKPTQFEYSLKLPQGESWFDAHIVPFAKNEVVLIVRNITNRKKMTEKLIEAQKMDSIGNLAGGIAHDFNNILSVIMGYSEMLMGDEKNHEKLECLRSIFQAAERSSQMTQKLLAFARKTKNTVEPVCLNAVILELCLMMRHSVPKSINCSKKLAEDLFTVDADLSQMHQMIMNICLNAIESMPDGGTITIETRNIRPDKTARIKYGELSPGQYVELSIKDTGGGIKKEHMPRIFEPFFTTKTTGEVRGTGLGLPAVYGIVQNHHGAIHVDSQPGKGTLVQVALPKGRLAFKGMKRTHQKITKGKGTLLVIDDDRQVREFTKKALENMGYKAITAEDGLKGIDLYKKNMPNISGVIIDMIMPKADGMKTFRQMKKINPQIKVLFATGYSKECNNGKISKLGACGIIHKPFRLKMLSDSIEKMLKG